MFQDMTEQAKTHLNLNITDLQEPHGAPDRVSKTVKSFKFLNGMLVELLETVNRINPIFVPKMDIRSILTLVNENLHSILRFSVHLPSVLNFFL